MGLGGSFGGDPNINNIPPPPFNNFPSHGTGHEPGGSLHRPIQNNNNHGIGFPSISNNNFGSGMVPGGR